MFTLLLAAISKKNKGQCKDYSITIKGAKNNFFIDKKDVEQLLMKATHGNIKGVQVSSFNLHSLEQMLEGHTWISDAELYFDNQDVLHISITEKEPLARVFTTGSNSFYIDSAAKRMPLSDKISARVPVFTGFPDKKTWNAKDSALLNDIRAIANYITNDPFWMSQVSQMDISQERNFEMVPLVGNHIVKFGNAANIDQKFKRLMIFYQQVLSKTGFDKYKVIDVQYKGQVVVSRYAGDPKVDSVQLRKNIEKLLQQSIDAQNDTLVRTVQVAGKYKIDTAAADLPNDSENPEHKLNPNPGLSTSTPVIRQQAGGRQADKVVSLPAKTAAKPGDEKKQPKAVMPKRPAENDNGGYN